MNPNSDGPQNANPIWAQYVADHMTTLSIEITTLRTLLAGEQRRRLMESEQNLHLLQQLRLYVDRPECLPHARALLDEFISNPIGGPK